ncbi:Uncharacterized conserved protein YbgA, DUF1722 family [Geoalkalibacter ferrihydriticus]|uniref:DUF1722 domain-containing protein n=2 Tax=Geoalkalibacter ferrihydriticus TaxID=392333 RepID=A0A0C2EHB3_9BACT|nr:DUF523 and DUF1722 domain-containing protein [Geoalkalibacter ferrihydriticus]KIH78063.1 hypothetical protein GFER_05605 [Geoalkalibacter ferrihydriticus DSM 17813]SDM31020.1 Uncharacterized conserved protein YbgA, DUF1722 family [Geoalkalibacter ferrihydriticus]
MTDKIRIGISSCLLGENVRYDGGHQLDRLIRDFLGPYLEFVPVCPEVEVGLPIPRETLRLVGDPEHPRLVFSRSGEDITERMESWAQKRCEALAKDNLCGFIFKGRSPSSGMERVKLYDKNGVPAKQGVGVFARIFMERFPLVPVEEDGRLHDDKLRENFIECLFTFKRWRDLVAQGKSRGRLVDFHTRHKLLLMAHSPELYREMGKLVADAKSLAVDELYDCYLALLMKAMRLKTTARKNINVMQHLLGYFKRDLSADEKQELLESFEHYRAGHVPLIVPITLINHYVRKYDQPYLKTQYYLKPHPQELQLRNHV